MGNLSPLERLWKYCWQLDRHTRNALKMRPTALLDYSDLTPEERELAERLATDGGRNEGQQAAEAGGSGGNGDDGDDGSAFDVGGQYDRRQKIGLVLGPLLFAVIMLAPTPEGLSTGGQAVGATTAWVAVWWIGESIPIPATSLLPIVLFPLTGALDIDAATAPYSNDLIFLFMGGFFIAMAMQRWDLHRRIALRTIRVIGTGPKRIILGFMIATAFLSMWVSNTATTMMMTPIGLAVILQTGDIIERTDKDIPTEQGEFRFGTALMLCIAYSASVGGVGTIIGTPPNLVLVGAINETFDQTITFAQWMLYGVPIAALGVGIIWVYVTQFLIPPRMESLPGGLEVIDEELEALGSMTREEKLVLVIFAATAFGWLTRSFLLQPIIPGIADSMIAIAGALALFLVPAHEDDGSFTFLLDWETAVNIPWGIILLFGGGLSIAAGFQETGLAEWIGGLLGGLQGVSIVLVMIVVVVLTIFMTEVTSNTATTAMLMPIMASLAVGLSIHPYGIMIAAATAASFAFMLPVATPPNAVVFGSGYITMPQMAKTGFGLNIIGILLVILLALTWLPLIWGINLTELPSWAGMIALG
ncbi:SLC13 family permease [Haloarcula nitratireducens]|uniref:SLC13 family permease n=1 Tax=Haloarcula nitratireducens TaxID=2487749 RepID=A0AAW4PII9_9EURY|nr:SLC13 family permease [Halomicroarcula nitratireducens]MBX0297110.1 SLC13 family permease [Halomicroarcula nitratireducens]